tara:strand:+ start:777 stop:1742 length:966 start_codon:yes stop_codon:yes gene_type:complete
MNLRSNKKNKSIAIIGNQKITNFLINYLSSKKIDIKYILTLEDKKKFKITDPYNFKKSKIKKIDLKSYNLKNTHDINTIKKIKIDFLIVFGWSRLIPSWLIDHVKIATLGVHAGMYNPPRSRGRAVFNWSIIGNFKKMVAYCMILKPGIDNGDILIKENLKISQFDDINSIYIKNSIISSRFFFKILSQWSYFYKNRLKQKKIGSTYLPKRSVEDSFINWQQSSSKIYNFIRALKDPYPNAFTYLNNTKILISDAIIFELDGLNGTKVGEVVGIYDKNHIIIKCKTGYILTKKIKFNNEISIKIGSIFKSNKSKKFDLSKI